MMQGCESSRDSVRSRRLLRGRRFPTAIIGWALLAASAGAASGAQAPVPPSSQPASPLPQPRTSGQRIAVNPASIVVDDGDTVAIRWSGSDLEEVRILGIDSPETRHIEHNLPYAQAFGEEARAFALGAFANADRIEVLRASMLDPFGRTLAYVFIDGRNYSTLIIEARLAEESVTRYGDNGMPAPAADVLAAARAQGPLPFESPAIFRARMAALTEWLKARNAYPPP
jgi:endonuclease YncB( thermonuclease family)